MDGWMDHNNSYYSPKLWTIVGSYSIFLLPSSIIRIIAIVVVVVTAHRRCAHPHNPATVVVVVIAPLSVLL